MPRPISLLDSSDWWTVFQNKSNTVPCNFNFCLSILCFESNQNKANNQTNPKTAARHIASESSCLFCPDSSHFWVEHPHILHLTLLAAENVHVYWKALPLGWSACQDTCSNCTQWISPPSFWLTIPIDVADGGASFQSSTIQCIYTDIGEAFWIIF